MCHGPTMDHFEDNLIELIQNYPSLYRNKDKKLISLIAKDNCWREIAGQLNKTPEECKNKWRNIRDNYRKNQNRKKTGNAASISKYDDERLKFIDVSFEERDSSDVNSRNIHDVDEKYNILPVEILLSPGSSTSSTQMSPCDPLLQQPSQEGRSIIPNETKNRTTHAKKKKRDILVEKIRKNRAKRTNMLRQISEKSNTPIHVFFKSMADVVCQFPPEKIAQTRSQVCNIVTEMELSVLKQRDTSSP